MESNPLRGLFGVSSPQPEVERVAPQPTAPTENIYYEIPSGMIEKLLLILMLEMEDHILICTYT